MDFTGEGEARLSAYLRATGALKSWVNLPGSESTIENVPHWLPLRFSADDVYTNQAGDEAPVKVETKISKLQKIIEVVEADRDAEYRPISVQLDEDDNWELQLDVGEESRSGVSGSLGAKSVENKTGSPVENYYFDGFDEIVNVLGNGVELQTAPGGNPCAFVQRNGDHVIRHVNGTVSQG